MMESKNTYKHGFVDGLFAGMTVVFVLWVVILVTEKYAEFNKNTPAEGTEKKVVEVESTPTNKSTGWTKWQTFEATAYTHQDEGCNKLTKTEFRLCPEARIVAVDPDIIPLGSKVEIQGFGIFYAEDIGGAIKLRRIDVHYWNVQDALEFGRRKVKLRWKEL